MERQLGEIFEFIRNGVSIKQSNNKGGFPITRIETIWDESIDYERVGYADVFENNLEKYEKYILKEGDILMSHINSIKHLGKCAIYEGHPEIIIHGMNLLCLRVKKDISFSSYWKYYFRSAFFKMQILKIANQSVNQASFSTGNLKKIKIPLSPLAEQKRIAKILDQADQLRQLNQQILAEYDALTKSLFLDMFGDPVVNPMGWEIIKIADVVDEVKYGTSLKAGEEGKYPYLRMNNITYTGYMDYSSLKYIDVNEKEYPKYSVKKGDLLFNRTNSKELVGKTGLITDDINRIIAGYLIRVRVSDAYNPYYVWRHLNSEWAKLTLRSMCKSIVGMANINAKELQKIKILKAPLELQNKFAKKIKNIEAQKAKAQAALAASEDLFNNLLQKAFKGEL